MLQFAASHAVSWIGCDFLVNRVFTYMSESITRSTNAMRVVLTEQDSDGKVGQVP